MNYLSQCMCAGALTLNSMSAAAAPTQQEARASVGVEPAASNRATSAGTGSSVLSDGDVGDADSFGRSLRWLGVTINPTVHLSSDCSHVIAPETCQLLAPEPAITHFDFMDVSHITLPAKASNSLLCYWLSPVFDFTYDNSTAATVIANVYTNPTLTIENPVLATPGLIDPSTGLPFGGKLTASMTSAQRFAVPLLPGLHFNEHKRDSAVCMDALRHKRLMEDYGLSADQAKEFFKQPMTVRLNVHGSVQYVSEGFFYFGLRIVGD